MKKAGIIGLGLLGGSLAKALKNRAEFETVVACSRNESSLKQALKEGIIDNYSLSVSDIFYDCDIIFICTPVNKILNYITALIPFLHTDCIITDVGSTKKSLYEAMLPYDKKVCFIGGHPMAGSEQTGYEASKDYLFENCYYVLTPLPSVSSEKVALLSDLVKTFGAIPLVIPPDQHDFIVGTISHVPHVVASSLVNMVKKLDGHEKYMATLAAGGFKDITRIASSSSEMWSSISVDNKTEILKITTILKNILTEFESHLICDNETAIFDFFKEAKDYRDNFSNKSPGTFIKVFEILVDVVDKPGIIATIATTLSVNNINIKNIGIINNREYENGIMQIIFDNENNRNKSIKILEEMNFTVYQK